MSWQRGLSVVEAELPGDDLCPQGTPAPHKHCCLVWLLCQINALCCSSDAPSRQELKIALMLFAGTAVAPTLNGPIAGVFSAIRQKGV